MDLIKFLELSNNYASADHIHNIWYARQKQAEKDVIADMIKLYGNDK